MLLREALGCTTCHQDAHGWAGSSPSQLDDQGHVGRSVTGAKIGRLALLARSSGRGGEGRRGRRAGGRWRVSVRDQRAWNAGPAHRADHGARDVPGAGASADVSLRGYPVSPTQFLVALGIYAVTGLLALVIR